MNNHISELIGRTITGVNGLFEDSDTITFCCSDGSVWELYHERDCCEYVRVYDVCGDQDDLVGGYVVDAREDTSGELHGLDPENVDSFTWTFYNISTSKGSVNLRWLGESNGYYSESVSFRCVVEAKPKHSRNH